MSSGEKTNGAVIPIKLLFIDDLAEERAALKRAQAEVEKYEKSTTNKAGWIYERGLQKRRQIVVQHLANIQKLTINAERITEAKKISLVKTSAQRRKEIETKASAESAKKASGTYVGKWKSAFATLTRYASSYMLINLAVNALKQVATEILHVQDNLAKVKAISGATDGDISTLNDTVWELSAAFGKSASEVSKFTIQMAKLGKSASEIKDLGEESAMLSSILGEDMVQSGVLLVTTMNQFNLSTKEAGRVASTFFDTIANSPADVDGLRTAMQYVGVTASNLGLSIEQTGRMIGFLANNGMKMSKAGTGLRNVLSKLSQKGGNLNDVLERMHEKGLSTMDAFSEFGKRGGNAALLLVNHWEEVKRLMNEDMPTAAARMIKSAQAMDSVSSAFSRLSRTFIGFFGGSGAEPALNTNSLISLTKGLDAAGISAKQLGDDIKQLGKRYKNAFDLRNALYKKYFGYSNGAYQKFDNEIATGLDLVIKATFDEQKSNKAFDDVRSKIKDFMQEKLKEIEETGNDFSGELADLPAPEDGVQTIPWWGAPEPANFVTNLSYRTQLDRFTKMLENKLPSIDPKDARKIAKDALSRATITLRTTIKYTVKEYAKQIEKLQKESADILATGKINQFDMATIKSNDQAIKDLKEIICRMSPLYDGCPEAKKIKKKTDNTIRDAINAYERWYKETKAKIRAAYADAISKESNINDVTYKNKRNPLSLSEFMTQESFDPKEHTFKDQKKFIDTYDKYATDFLTKLSVRVHSTADRAKELALKQYTDSKKAIDTQIENLKSLLPKVDSSNMTATQKDTAKENINNKISDRIVERTKLTEDYHVEVNKTNSDEEKAIKRLLVLLEKLGLAKKKSTADLAKDKATETKAFISQIIGEAYDIYQKFNNAILQNTTDRLNAEKQVTEAHYSEAGDILRAQLENNLITEGQYAKRRKSLEKKKVDEENRINKAQFDAKKENDMQNAIIGGIVATAKAAMVEYSTKGLLGAATAPVAIALVAAEAAAEVAAISSRKFYPVKYATGGWINGQSHAAGGVPISINNGGQIEAEGGEMIINKTSAAKNAALLENINSGNDFTEQLKTVLESARIRAFFTDKDLDAAERNRKFGDNSINYLR